MILGGILKVADHFRQRVRSPLEFFVACTFPRRLLSHDVVARSLTDDQILNEAVDIRQQVLPLSRDSAYSLLQLCGRKKDLDGARRLQALLNQSGIDSVEVLANNLIRLFALCSCLFEANQAFDRVSLPSVYTWTAIISAHASHGQGEAVFTLYTRMHLAGISVNRYIYLAVLKACTFYSVLKQGRYIHLHIIENSNMQDVIVGNALVNMYAKCGSLEESRGLFDNLPHRDVISWGAMVAAYVQHGQGCLALECFLDMQHDHIKPDKITFSSMVKACGMINAISDGRFIHDQILEHRLEMDVVVGSSLIDMYAKCSSLEEAINVFQRLPCHNVVSWGTIIAGCAEQGEGETALYLFNKMQDEKIKPDRVTFLSILKACGSLKAIEQGRAIHGRILKQGLESDLAVANTLIDMYNRCGNFEESFTIFENLHSPNVVSWSTMIAGYTEQEKGCLALDCFEKMEECGVEPDRVMFLNILRACGTVGAIAKGRLFHEQIIEEGLESNVSVGNTLIDLYAKCGSLIESSRIFGKLQYRSVVSWGAMISGYAQHGEGLLALDCFKDMQEEGINPDRVILLSVLVACSHAGLADKGRFYFDHMKELYGILPDIDHINCMIDLLGRAGCLKEAEDLLHATGQRNVLGWMSLLSACKVHGNIELGRQCFNEVVKGNNSFAEQESGKCIQVSRLNLNPCRVTIL